MAVINVTDNDFENEVLNSEKPVMVDFWASWCMPCRMMAPTVEAIGEELDDTVKVVKVNVDESPNVSMKYKIMSIPTLGFFKNGELVDKIVGVTPKEEVIDKINGL